MSSAWLTAVIVAALVFFPILGNLRPDLVSFLPSMRQYAGNWASATWAFAPGAEEKLDEHIIRPQPEHAQPAARRRYPRRGRGRDDAPAARLALDAQPGPRPVLADDAPPRRRHRHLLAPRGRVRCNSILGFNFGDGHLHDEHLIAAIQRRCNFAPGEFIVAWVESQPIHKGTQDYKVIDAALGVIERGTWKVADAVNEQPWLPNGPIPFDVQWTLDGRRLGNVPDRAEPQMQKTTERGTVRAA